MPMDEDECDGCGEPGEDFIECGMCGTLFCLDCMDDSCAACGEPFD